MHSPRGRKGAVPGQALVQQGQQRVGTGHIGPAQQLLVVQGLERVRLQMSSKKHMSHNLMYTLYE